MSLINEATKQRIIQEVLAARKIVLSLCKKFNYFIDLIKLFLC